MCPLFLGGEGFLFSCAQGGFGYCGVSPWVGVSSGGGCPRPQKKQGVRVGVRCVDPGP